MKGILEFDLPEDQEDFNVAVKAKDLYFVLLGISGHLRDRLKYGDLTKGECKAYKDTQEVFYELLDEYTCSLDMMT